MRLRISELMEKFNIGQRELSRATKIRQATISAYCNNTFKQISREHIDILCDYFECEPSELIEYKPIRTIKITYDE